jgi:hypothetical protein
MKRPDKLFRLLSGTVWILLVMVGTACERDSADDRSGLYGKWTDTEDGTVYRILQLGDQTWLADNLNRGDMIDGAEDQKIMG